MELIFENEYGSLRFRGKRSRNNSVPALYTKKVTGLGFPEREEMVRQFVGEAGQHFISQRELARIIGISADLCGSHNLQGSISKMMEILYYPGKLTIQSGLIHRCIMCRCSGFEEGEWHGNNILSLALQFTCDQPFFSGASRHKEMLFLRRDLIQGQMTLPCVFTERVSRKVMINQGAIRVEPVILLHCSKQNNTEADSDNLSVINHRTGQKIELLYTMQPGETVTIDIPNRQVTSNLTGDITAQLTPDSFLSDFWLEPGENLLEGVSKLAWDTICISLSYDHQYIEAVI